MERIREFLSLGEKAGSSCRIRVPRNVFAGRAGLFSADLNGVSLDYRDFREYQPGDDIRSIDWNAFGRSDRLIVKLYREEITPHLDLVIDGSRSMAVDGYDRSGPAVFLAALLYQAAANTGMSSSVFLAEENFKVISQGDDYPGDWQGIVFDSRTSLAQSFLNCPPAFRYRSIRVVVSDFLFPGKPVVLAERIARNSSFTVFIRILTDSEIPDHSGRIALVDSETGDYLELLLDRAAIDKYRRALSAHNESWNSAAQSCGASFQLLEAADLLKGSVPESLLSSGFLEVY